jgi:ArsR family transcriptional regulator, arsenate/arsenite/antimonite-responsive transcriptional repressor
VQGTAVTVDSQAKIFGALSDPVRLRFVRLLADGEERTGSDLAESLGISLALLCHHSKILVDAGVVTKRKEAQTAYYRANRSVLKQAMKDLLA